MNTDKHGHGPDAWARLARWRVPLGWVLSVAALWFAAPTWSSIGAGAAVGSLGEALRIWAAGHLEKGREVTTSGPYALTRHPLYAGSTLLGIGFAIAAHSVFVAVLVAVYLAITLTAAVRSEEAHLTDKFGGDYPAYRDGRAAAAPRAFSVRRAWRNREYRALLGFVALVALLAIRRWMHV
jgi:protein-S-isoprenylcysteine O-methyltransferase Ste14